MPTVCKVAERRINDGYDYFAWNHDNSPRHDWITNGYSQWLRSIGVENTREERINRYYDPEYAAVKLRMLERFCSRQALTADPLPIKSAPW